MSPVVTSAKLLSSLILESMLCSIYPSVITCTWIYLDLLEMWAVEVMTKARCRVGTVTAIAASARLVTSTNTHRCPLN